MKTVFGASVLSFCYSFLFIQFLISLIYGDGTAFNTTNFIILFILSPFAFGYVSEVIKLEGLRVIAWLGLAILISISSYFIFYNSGIN
ncbi:hypothetical protein CWI80_10730 [Pseudidiomarina sediminum]|uniref:Uncharacterized protein n=1 Tax=Pseudidiomarina sediminum TaxID=431675 RepID=A0A432Z359_9GAMM|nr:hypothetical protein CWI80_10730 [Pseudidiomarina sediminum]